MMRVLILFLLLTGPILAQKKFHFVDSTSFDLWSYYLGNSNDTSTNNVSFEEFEVSDLVTWKDYKLFLNEVLRTKGPQTHEQFTPKLPSKILIKALTSEIYDKEAVTGVSWKIAREYCKWKTVYDNKYEMNFLYRLPSLDEWTLIHHELGTKIDIDQGVAEWTLTSKDESYYHSKTRLGYQFEANENDSPAFKRKVVVGKSFSFNPDKISEFYNLSYYQDSSYANVGFRLLKIQERFYISDFLKDWYCDYVNQYDEWELGDEITNYIGANYPENQTNSSKKLNGLYKSYYPNGSLKAKGFFSNNKRLGKWEIHDSLGNLIQERNYTGYNSFTITYPIPKSKLQHELQNAQQYFPERDSNKIISYEHVQERDVYFSQRHWWKIEPEGNRELFRKDYLLQTLNNAFKNGEVNCYDTLDDQFKSQIPYNEYSKRSVGKAVRFEFKSDFYYDISRNYGESRIIGICPVVLDTLTNQEVKLGWFYFPQIRLTLRKAYVNKFSRISLGRFQNGTYPSSDYYPYNLDDLFFFKDYAFTITKVSSQIRINSIEEEVSISPFHYIELEHDLWMHIAGD